MRKICFDVGYIGGATIFHGFSYYSLQESIEKGFLFGWNWHPHVHKIGFIMGGYGKCRICGKFVRRYRTRGGKWIEHMVLRLFALAVMGLRPESEERIKKRVIL